MEDGESVSHRDRISLWILFFVALVLEREVSPLDWHWKRSVKKNTKMMRNGKMGSRFEGSVLPFPLASPDSVFRSSVFVRDFVTFLLPD